MWRWEPGDERNRSDDRARTKSLIDGGEVEQNEKKMMIMMATTNTTTDSKMGGGGEVTVAVSKKQVGKSNGLFASCSMGFQVPTAIQVKAIPVVISGLCFNRRRNSGLIQLSSSMATAAAAMAMTPRALLRSHTTVFTPSSRTLPLLPHSAHRRPLAVSAAHQSPNVIDILQERGLLESTTSESLRSTCSNPSVSPVKVYCGFDPTAESLHLGNLLGIVVLSWFRRSGHKVVALVGGATGRVGDPSGKSLERPELDAGTIERNCTGIGGIIAGILDRAGESGTLEVGCGKDGNLEVGFGGTGGLRSDDDGSFVILNNFDWWKEMRLLDFLRDVGKFARVGAMMAKESVKKRLMSEEGMSYTEFTYQLLQGYDFLYMFKNMGVNVQIGGSDQWGNITAGTDLIRRILQAEGAYGLTFPLLLKSDGTKFGKSESGAIWLSPSMLSPYKFYQYFFSIPDVDVIRFLKILTFMSMDEIRELEEGMKRPGYVPNTVQRVLAKEITRFVHGESGLQEALKATKALRPGAETELNWETIEGIAKDVPSCSLAYNKVLNSCLVDLSVSTGLFNSKSAARRLLKQGGLYLNNIRIDSEDKLIEAADIVDGKVLLLSAGKKNKLVIRIA